MMISTKKLRISMMKWIYTILIKKKRVWVSMCFFMWDLTGDGHSIKVGSKGWRLDQDGLRGLTSQRSFFNCQVHRENKF